jgi:predicted metal-dependent enzyme (double-stranded beta helix superfamily)
MSRCRQQQTGNYAGTRRVHIFLEFSKTRIQTVEHSYQFQPFSGTGEGLTEINGFPSSLDKFSSSQSQYSSSAEDRGNPVNGLLFVIIEDPRIMLVTAMLAQTFAGQWESYKLETADPAGGIIMPDFDLDDFVQELRAAARQDEPVKKVRELMTEAFRDPAAIRAAMPEFENDDEILFEDDSVSIWFVRFMPGLHVPPHDHQTTATIGVYEGAEDNHFYLREPGRLVHKGTRRVEPGDVIALKPDGIHSVEAAGGQVTCGIHVYLAALTKIERSLFDWESGVARRYTDENYDAMKRVCT